jgi:hypothetical protein
MAPPVPPVSLRQCFAPLPDPRREHNRLHNLWDVIALTICAVIAGADAWTEVEEYGRLKQDFLATFLELPAGIPSHDTIGRVFARLDPAAFQQSFQAWVAALVEATDGRVIAIDGKTLRHSFDTAGGKGPLHLISAWATANHLTLGQRAVADKSNEITAIPELLRLLDLHGAIVTIDAMGCQKDVAARVEAGGGRYVLSLKENHGTLHADVHPRPGARPARDAAVSHPPRARGPAGAPPRLGRPEDAGHGVQRAAGRGRRADRGDAVLHQQPAAAGEDVRPCRAVPLAD